MNNADRTLFLGLGAVNLRLAAFGVALQEGVSLSADEQPALAHRLVDLAEAIRQRAEHADGVVIDGVASDEDTGPPELPPLPEG